MPREAKAKQELKEEQVTMEQTEQPAIVFASKLEADVFAILNQINVNEHVEEKDTGKAKLKYLSWVWAWQKVREKFPDATYTIERDPATNLPYFYDPQCGIMVYTTCTIKGETHEMWLPVMDGANNAMRFEEYEYSTKYGPKKVNKATMMDINKALMRCLAKNLAMFGLGLYIYAGEDLPVESDDMKATVATLIDEVASQIERIKTRDNITTPEQKRVLANDHIKPFLGSDGVNYKMCKDADKLAALLEHLKAA